MEPIQSNEVAQSTPEVAPIAQPAAPVEETPTAPPAQEAPAEPTPAPTFKVSVFDVHSGSYAEFPKSTIGEAIDFYKRVVATAREGNPFLQLDDLNWIAVAKFRGGKVRIVAITNGEKVFGRMGGVANLNRAQQRQGLQAPRQTPVSAVQPNDVPALT